MIITCPSCGAQYDIPDQSIGPKGRRVKCTSCGYTWLQLPPTDPSENFEAIQEQITENFTQPIETDNKPVSKTTTQAVPVVKDHSHPKTIGIGVGLGVILFILFVILSIPFRFAVTSSLPSAALFYQMIGFDVPAPGIEMALEGIESKLMEDGTLLVRGKIVNKADTEQKVAGLLIRVDGAKGWLKDWPIDLNNKVFRPKEEISFEYRLPDVPSGVENVTIRFAE